MKVAHLAEMNHGPRFWKLVARCVPDLERAKGTLLESKGLKLEEGTGK